MLLIKSTLDALRISPLLLDIGILMMAVIQNNQTMRLIKLKMNFMSMSLLKSSSSVHLLLIKKLRDRKFRLETKLNQMELRNGYLKYENINLEVNVSQLIEERDNLKTKKAQYKLERDLMTHKGKNRYTQNNSNKVKLNKIMDKLK